MAKVTLCHMPATLSTRLGAPRSVQLRPVVAFNRAVGQLSSGRGSQLLARRRHAPSRIAAVLDVGEESWEAEVLKAELPVLIDFWATWCGPCKLVAPSMVWAEKEFEGKLKVVKVDCTGSNKSLMERFKVYGLPCLLVFKDGEEVAGSHREGAITRKDLVKYIETHVGLSQAATPAAAS